MKKSVVAAVAASNLTMFSGLVNAEGSQNGSGGSGCTGIVITGKYDPTDPNQCQRGPGTFSHEWWCTGGCSVGSEDFTDLILKCDDKNGTNPLC